MARFAPIYSTGSVCCPSSCRRYASAWTTSCRLRAAFFEVASAERRVALIADEPAANRYRFIQKTAVLKFVDEITVEFVEAGEGASSLFLLSRSRAGWWDLGVNRRRIGRWLRALDRRLAA